eukprot:scaffold2.g6995.t1
MLALPAVTAPAGLVPTATSLCGMWVLLTLEALLIAEVNVALHEERGEKDARSIITLHQMAEATLGSPGKMVTVVYLFLAYSLLVAYLAKASEVLDFFARSALAGVGASLGGPPPAATAAAVVAGTAALFLVGGPKAADRLNQGLTSVLLGLFLGILVAGGLQADVGGALAAAPAHAAWGALSPALPIVFLSLVYHDLVPVLVKLLHGNRAALRTAIVMGSFVPLAMFLSWELVALSLVPGGLVGDAAPAAGGVMQAALHLSADPAAAVAAPAAAAATAAAAAASTGLPVDGPGLAMAVDPLEVFVRRSGPLVGSAVQGFSLLAVTTSFMTTTLTLSETMTSEVPPLLREAARLAGLAQASVSGSLLASADEGESDAEAGPAGAGEEGEAQLCPQRLQRLALGLTLGPPLAATIYNPGSFMGMLTVAGAYGMTLLYGCLPPLMAWRQRAAREAAQPGAPARGARAARRAAPPPAPATGGWQAGWEADGLLQMVPGGQPVLAALLSAAVGLEVSRLVADFGLPLGSAAAAAPSGDLVETATRVAAHVLPAAEQLL